MYTKHNTAHMNIQKILYYPRLVEPCIGTGFYLYTILLQVSQYLYNQIALE